MIKYSDLNTNFDVENPQSKCLNYDIEVIKSSLLRLFMTGKGECPFNRDYGTTLKTLLFENNLDASDVANFLYMDITTWEPRVSLNPSDVYVEQVDLNTYQITCTFVVPSLNSTKSSVTTTLSRG